MAVKEMKNRMNKNPIASRCKMGVYIYKNSPSSESHFCAVRACVPVRDGGGEEVDDDDGGSG